MNVRDIAEIREELKAKLKAAEESHRVAVICGLGDTSIRIEEFRIIHHLSELAFLDRFGVVEDVDLRTLLTPEQFHENNELRIQEMLASPDYRGLKARERTAESALPPAEPCPEPVDTIQKADESAESARLAELETLRAVRARLYCDRL